MISNCEIMSYSVAIVSVLLKNAYSCP